MTAVEWLKDEIRWYISNDDRLYDMFKKAKEMAKEQMVDFAFKYGDLTTHEIADSFDKEYKTNEK